MSFITIGDQGLDSRIGPTSFFENGGPAAEYLFFMYVPDLPDLPRVPDLPDLPDLPAGMDASAIIHPMPVAVMCVRTRSQSPVTRWDCLGDARELAALIPCGPNCESNHVIAWRESGVIACELVTGEEPEP